MLNRLTRWLNHSSSAKETAVAEETTIDLAPLLEQWNEQGYLVLPRFVPQTLLDAYAEDVAQALRHERYADSDLTLDILDGPQVGQRVRLREANADAINATHKLNDLYLESAVCRQLNLFEPLCEVLRSLLDGDPVIINSLSFTQGSQQPYHFDTYYMPPPKPNKMVVSSICLEDQTASAGPLRYYPGSHKIPPHHFSHGQLHALDEEMAAATQATEEELKVRNLQSETFVGNAGDVFIWHAQLYHGGSPVIDSDSTRRTLVTHYWRKQDLAITQRSAPSEGGFYLRRNHQST